MRVSKNWKNKRTKDLLSVITSITNHDLAGRFFRDLCTLDELKKMAERWEVARLLHKGLSYRAVAKKTGASTTTVTRVAHWLRDGEGGYQKVLKRL